jgi:hypothetical protein
MNLAPNGEESNLTPEQYKLVRTPEFKAWFGDWENSPETASKVVDENGEPLVVYRGLQTQTDYKKSGFQYFALYYDYAEMWSEDMGGIGNVISVFLCIKEPLLFEKYNKELAEYDLYSFGKQGLLQVSSELESKMPYLAQIGLIENTDGAEYLADKLYEELKTCDGVLGYDAGHYGEQFVFVTKEPTQIKLADGRNTTFNASNLDMRFNLGGDINTYEYNIGGL